LAAREHVSGIFLTRVTRIFQDPLFTKFVPASSRQRVAAAARSAARSSAPVISLLRPCYCLFFFLSPFRFPVDFPGVARAAPVFSPVVYREVHPRMRQSSRKRSLRWRSRLGMSARVKRAALPSLAEVRHLGGKARVRSTPAPARDPMAANGP